MTLVAIVPIEAIILNIIAKNVKMIINSIINLYILEIVIKNVIFFIILMNPIIFTAKKYAKENLIKQ